VLNPLMKLINIDYVYYIRFITVFSIPVIFQLDFKVRLYTLGGIKSIIDSFFFLATKFFAFKGNFLSQNVALVLSQLLDLDLLLTSIRVI